MCGPKPDNQQVVSYRRKAGGVSRAEFEEMMMDYLEGYNDVATGDILGIVSQFMETKKDILEKGKELDFYLKIRDELDDIGGKLLKKWQEENL